MNKKELKELIATIWLGAMFVSGVRHLGNELINQDRFSGFPKQINTTQITKEAEEDLTAEQYAILQDKIKEIYANLGIENMQDKSAEEQKRAAYKILRHVINTTTYLNDDKINNGVNVNNREKDSVYQTICQNLNIDFMNSESMAYSLLLSECGLKNKLVTVGKNYGTGDRSSKALTTREVVYIYFNGEQNPRVCDPISTKIAGTRTKEHDGGDLSGVFMEENNYLDLFKGYYVIDEHEPITLTSIAPTTKTTDQGMER